MGRLIAKARTSLQRDGFLGTLQRATNRLCVKVRDQSPSRRRARHRKEEHDREFDRRFHVDTAGFLALDCLAIGSGNKDHGFAYDPIDPEKFQCAVGSLALRHQDHVFIDFGSGKGKSVLLASELPFRKIIGVEFAPDLHAIAQRNVQSFSNDKQQCRDIELVCMDAAVFPLPPVPAVLFFFNPFGKEVMARVIENVKRSCAEHPRELFIVYATPVLDALWTRAGFVEKLKEQAGYFAVYKTRAPD